jgi:hypothetical protein
MMLLFVKGRNCEIVLSESKTEQGRHSSLFGFGDLAFCRLAACVWLALSCLNANSKKPKLKSMSRRRHPKPKPKPKPMANSE